MDTQQVSPYKFYAFIWKITPEELAAINSVRESLITRTRDDLEQKFPDAKDLEVDIAQFGAFDDQFAYGARGVLRIPNDRPDIEEYLNSDAFFGIDVEVTDIAKYVTS